MVLTSTQTAQYERDGFVVLPDYFNARELDVLRAELPRLASQETPGRVLEKDSDLVRALHGCHQENAIFDRVTRLARMVGPAEQVVGGPVYVYQFKINFKAAFGGDVWPWHQDFVFWHKDDGMPAARVTNIAVFLDAVTEFNGPLMLIPGSHRHGLVDVAPLPATGADPARSWEQSFSADLKYSLDRETIARLVAERGLVAPKGEAGTALIFHPNLAHASTPNLSPFDRTMMVVTYNSVENVPVPAGPARPEFLVSRDTRPLAAMPDESLAA